MVLKTTGHDVLGIEDNDVAEFVEMVISVGIILLSWWKNNSVTKNAQKADQYLKKLKKLEEEQTNE